MEPRILIQYDIGCITAKSHYERCQIHFEFVFQSPRNLTDSTAAQLRIKFHSDMKISMSNLTASGFMRFHVILFSEYGSQIIVTDKWKGLSHANNPVLNETPVKLHYYAGTGKHEKKNPYTITKHEMWLSDS